MRKLILGAAALFLLVAGTAPASEGVTPMLKMDTTYHFMFLSPAIPAATLPGRSPGMLWAFAWEGTVKGDINGVIRWWVEFIPPDQLTGVGRFEIWDCEPVYPASDCQDPAKLIMAGYDAFGYTSATDWEGKGVVTYVGAEYQEEYGKWFGRRITDGGYVDFIPGTEPPVPLYGEGWFTIYDRPSNKH
jgi:hypothetical protein